MPGTPLHFRLGFFLSAGWRQEDRFGDAATLNMGKTCVRVRAEMEVCIEDGSAPWRIRLSLQ